MTVQTFIVIDGQEISTEGLDLPDKDKRAAWFRAEDGSIQVDPVRALELDRSRAVMSRTEFALKAANLGKITKFEAADWAAKKSIPAIVQGMVDSLPEDQRGDVYFDLMTADNIRRNAEIMPAIGQIFQMTDAQIDAFFGIDVS